MKQIVLRNIQIIALTTFHFAGCIDDTDCQDDTYFCNRNKHECQPITCPCQGNDENAFVDNECDEPRPVKATLSLKCKTGFVFDHDQCQKEQLLTCSAEKRAWIPMESSMTLIIALNV